MKKFPCFMMGAFMMCLSIQCLWGQTDQFSAVGLPDIKAATLSSARINGSVGSANQIPAGTIVIYKTNEGRFGKFLVRTYGYNLVIDFQTFNADGSIFRKRENLTIRGTWHADLDLGAEIKMSQAADFWWEQVDKTNRFLVPLNKAQMAVYRFPDYMAMLSNTVKTAKPGQELGSNMQVQVRELTPGVPVKQVAVDLVLVSKPTYPVPAPFAVYSPTYKDGVLLKGGREFVNAQYGLNPVKLNGTNKIPEDTPPGMYYLAAVVDAGNRVIESNERNNVSYSAIRIESDLFASIGVELIKKTDLSTARINGSNNASNRLKAGTIVVFKTTDGRFGKFLVRSYGYNLLIDWVTYNPNGTLFAQGNGLTIRGTYLYDMDKGLEINSALSDFWWEQVNSVERFLVPKNGASFAVYPRPMVM